MIDNRPRGNDKHYTHELLYLRNEIIQIIDGVEYVKIDTI